MTGEQTRRTLVLAAAAGLLVVGPGVTQAPTRARPRLEPVAETRLIMEGMAQANFRGLEKLLKQKPTDAESWTFARGQALLIAESADLLMLRPPRNQGESAWMQRATELRTAAARLGRATGSRDYERSRAAIWDVSHACNRCHQTFRVKIQVTPFATRAEEKQVVSP